MDRHCEINLPLEYVSAEFENLKFHFTTWICIKVPLFDNQQQKAQTKNMQPKKW